MKKTVIIALAGMMMFAFTQCGGSKGSKEYVETKELYEKIEDLIDDATDCDELQEAAMTLVFSVFAGGTYNEEERMTESEKEQMDELFEKLSDKIDWKSNRLGCDEDDDDF